MDNGIKRWHKKTSISFKTGVIMKFFKHSTSMISDSSIGYLLADHGLEAYGFYCALLEILVKNIEPEKERIFEFSCNTLMKHTGIKRRKNLEKLLKILENYSEIFVKFSEENIQIQYDKVFEIIENRGISGLKEIDKNRAEAKKLRTKELKNNKKIIKKEIEETAQTESSSHSDSQFMLEGIKPQAQKKDLAKENLIAEIIKHWNENSPKHGIPQITTKGVTWENRKKKLSRAIDEFPTLEDWFKIFAILKTKFFTSSDGREFVPNWDYLFRNNNYAKFWEEYQAEERKEQSMF
jgi:hypothetical protein